MKIADTFHTMAKIFAGRPGKTAGLLVVVLAVDLLFPACGDAGEISLSEYTAASASAASGTSLSGGSAGRGIPQAAAGETAQAAAGENPSVSAGGNVPAAAAGSASSSEGDTAADIKVYVCGAVMKEGVYELPADARVCDAIGMAGGFREDAEKSYINQAMLLHDADQIRVPTVQEAAQESGQAAGAAAGSGTGGNAGLSAGQESGAAAGGVLPGDDSAGSSGSAGQKTNLNTATSEQLQQIPGIGPAKAALIIAYREQHGSFASPEEIMKISGIKEGLYTKIEPFISVN
ncbi:MAG: helix-hairpin-helix domain-containing protein [Lachnospiraceae bacterium]|nr:helix-hairpin-helix domain-containing protein [Lachnospiraceae bacterium]